MSQLLLFTRLHLPVVETLLCLARLTGLRESARFLDHDLLTGMLALRFGLRGVQLDGSWLRRGRG